jgi:hypothetical protein
MTSRARKEPLSSPSSESFLEDPIRKRCKPEVLDHIKITWENIREDILRIEKVQFGDMAFDEETFRSAYSNPKCIFAVLRDTESGRIIAFSYVLSADESYNSDFCSERIEELRILDGPVAYIEDTAMDPQYIGHHLIGSLLSLLEETLVERGYKYLDRDAATSNNYAANIQKTYGSRILTTYPHDSKYGPQVFFRIRLFN